VDRWLAAFAALIFLLCLLLLLDDLRVIQLPFSIFGDQVGRSSDEKPIAKLIRQDNDVRRRSQHGIAWQSLNQGTPLYANDSVLTLSGSGAVVEVGSSGRVELGENTLIVLEKSRSDASGEIRLRFKRGRIAGRESSGSVTSGEWNLSFREDTKFEIRAVGEERLEVDVQSGSIDV
jgi:PAS domain-containing protein